VLKFSALVRTIVKQATIYFIVIVAVQIYLQVYLSLGIGQDLFGGTTTSLYCFFNPVLTLQFAVSLKKSTDPVGGQRWQLKHFTTLDFASRRPDDAENLATCENIETGPAAGHNIQ